MSGLMPGEIERDRRLEELWQKKLQAAKFRYGVAVAEVRAVTIGYREGAMQFPDGRASLLKAHRGESEARREYMRTLRAYTELLLRGTVPNGSEE